MKIDPYKHKERYLEWKESVKDGISEISKDDSDIILRYLNDMERGINIASCSAKGGRGYPRLNTLRNRMILFSKIFSHPVELVLLVLLLLFPLPEPLEELFCVGV